MPVVSPDFRHGWADGIERTEQDDIMSASHAFRVDPRRDKLNLSPGVVFDKCGRPFATDVFRRHLREVAGKDVGYLDAVGYQTYLAAHGRELVFGQELWGEMGGSMSDNTKPPTMAWCQTVGSSHALRMVNDLLLAKLAPNQQTILIDTGWQNHQAIFAELERVNYQHENPEDREYNHLEYLRLLKEHPEGSPILLQAAGYNDDGADRTREQWVEIIEIVRARRLLPVFDFAYNGLVKGFSRDNFAVKAFTSAGIPCFVCVSNSKNMSYGARLGSLYAVNFPEEQAVNLQTYMAYKLVLYGIGSAPRDSAVAAANMLTDEEDRAEHSREIRKVARRIGRVRTALARELNAPWIENKSGLFVKLKAEGLTDEELSRLRGDQGLYTPPSSRLNLGGIPERLVKIVAQRITAAIGPI